MDEKSVVDVSSFFIFEVTGDSEADLVDPNTATIDNDKDDAESCSHVSSDHPFVNEANGRRDNFQVCIDDKEEEEEGEEANSYYTKWPSEQHNKNTKSSVSVDSNHEEIMTETEKNKLFWETCLAS